MREKKEKKRKNKLERENKEKIKKEKCGPHQMVVPAALILWIHCL